MQQPIAFSPLHGIYQRHGASLQVQGRRMVARQFQSVDAELQAARSNVAMGESADEATLELEGEALSQLAAELAVGLVQAGCAAELSLPGIDGARWCRLTRHRARILAKRADASAVSSMLERSASCLHLADLSSGLTTLRVLGPRGPDLLSRIIRIDVDPRAFADRTLALTGAVGIPLQLVRWDLGSVLAYELTIGRDVAAYSWEALFHAGDDLALQPIGSEALARLQAAENGT